MADSDNLLLKNYRNAWQALRMIRETVETLGPPGALLSQDGVLRKYGPEPIHEGQAIVDALTKLLNERPVTTDAGVPPMQPVTLAGRLASRSQAQQRRRLTRR